jgi:hypothetical protein
MLTLYTHISKTIGRSPRAVTLIRMVHLDFQVATIAPNPLCLPFCNVVINIPAQLLQTLTPTNLENQWLSLGLVLFQELSDGWPGIKKYISTSSVEGTLKEAWIKTRRAKGSSRPMEKIRASESVLNMYKWGVRVVLGSGYRSRFCAGLERAETKRK